MVVLENAFELLRVFQDDLDQVDLVVQPVPERVLGLRELEALLLNEGLVGPRALQTALFHLAQP